MRLIPRHRQHQRAKAPRISITEAEIAADLLYPAHPRALRTIDSPPVRRRGR